MLLHDVGSAVPLSGRNLFGAGSFQQVLGLRSPPPIQLTAPAVLKIQRVYRGFVAYRKCKVLKWWKRERETRIEMETETPLRQNNPAINSPAPV
jgi:hypothetical protein